MPPRAPAAIPAETARQPLLSGPCARPRQPDEPVLRFLNESAPLQDGPVDWHPADRSRLWRYNLHYFDYLLWDVFDDATKSRLIDE